MKPNNLVSYWNQSHKKYLNKTQRNTSHYAIEREKQFPRKCNVIDLGGGFGIDSIYFAEKGHNVTLVDISPLALKEAEKLANSRHLSIKTIQLNLETDAFPIKTESIGVVYSRLALHYFDVDTTKRIFQEIYRVLNENGKTFLTLKSPRDAVELEFLKQNSQQIEPGIFLEEGYIRSRYSKTQLENILKEANIHSFIIEPYIEKLDSTKDYIKSGGKQFLLNEVIISK